MVVQVLFALQAVTSDGHAVVGRVEDVRVVQLAHRFEFLQHAADLNVDVLTAGELPAQFVSDRALIPLVPDTAHVHLVAHRHVGVVEGMGRQVVAWQCRLLRIGRRKNVLVRVIYGTVLGEQLRFAVAGVVGVGESEVDQEGIGVLGRFAFGQVLQDPLGVPGAARFVRAAASSWRRGEP